MLLEARSLPGNHWPQDVFILISAQVCSASMKTALCSTLYFKGAGLQNLGTMQKVYFNGIFEMLDKYANNAVAFKI